MKNKLLLLFSLLTVIAANAQWGYLKYPSYNNVLTYFFRQYSVKDIADTRLLKFQKKPDGWHIVLFKSLAGDTITSDQLLWSRDRDLFLGVRFNPATSATESSEHITNFLSDYDAQGLNMYPYYNYRGWVWDMIADYKDAKNLPDSMLYALGRTYSYATDELLNDNDAFADKSKMFKLADGMNCLSAEQLAEYNKYHNLAIETFKELKKVNPKFETPVGNIGIKIDDEYMVAYLDMMVYQNEQEANKELKDNLYSPFMISTAKNYLMSCDENAILFTNGDNDTFPLLYVQAKYKYRRDVLIVNMSLLGTARYINRMRSAFLDAAPLALSLTQDEIKDGVRDYAFISDKNATGSDYQLLQSVLEFEKSQNPADKMDFGTGEAVNYIPTHYLFLKHGDDKIEWTIQGQYITKSSLVMLDIIATNDWKRPICFAVTIGSSAYLGLDRYLEMRGFAYTLVPNEPMPAGTGQDGDPTTVNPHIMYNNMMNRFLYKGTDTLTSIEKQFGNDYRIFFYTLEQNLIKHQQKDSALKVLDKCVELFPDKQLPYDRLMYFFISAYYDFDKTEKADAIAEKFIYNMHHNIGFEGVNKDMKAAIHDALKQLLQAHDRKDLLAKLDEEK